MTTTYVSATKLSRNTKIASGYDPIRCLIHSRIHHKLQSCICTISAEVRGDQLLNLVRQRYSLSVRTSQPIIISFRLNRSTFGLTNESIVSRLTNRRPPSKDEHIDCTAASPLITHQSRDQTQQQQQL